MSPYNHPIKTGLAVGLPLAARVASSPPICAVITSTRRCERRA
jgi:hypothetical protein